MSDADSTTGDFDNLFDVLANEQGVSFTSLSSVPLSDLKDLSENSVSELSAGDDEQNKNVTVVTTKGDDGNTTCTEVSSNDEIAHADTIAMEERQERALDVSQTLFMAIGFVYLSCQLLASRTFCRFVSFRLTNYTDCNTHRVWF